jgi:hypothetical protein
MAHSTIAAMTPATAATGGTFYGVQGGADRKFTQTAAGAALNEAVDVAAQLTALGAVAKSTYDANSLLVANSDDTPIVLVVAEQRIVGRVTSGVIDDLTPAQVRSIINAVYAVGTVGASTVTLDAANGVVQTVTITGNITLAAPSNPVAGMEISIAITASGGARTITLGTITVPTGYTFSGVVASGSVRRLKVYYTGSVWLLTSNLEFA